MEPGTPITGAADRSSAASELRVSGDAPAVLLVDDDPAILDVVGRYIARCGCRVLTAGTPLEALQLVTATGRVDLLVSDVKMPEMTGPVLYRRLVELLPGLRVIYISGYTGPALPYQEIAADGALFLEKPFTAAQLAATLREALARPCNPAPAPR